MSFRPLQLRAYTLSFLVALKVLVLIQFSVSFCDAFDWPWFQSDPSENRNHNIPAKYENDPKSSYNSERPMIRQTQHPAEKKISLDHSCWQNAYMELVSSCREILKDEEKKARFAYQLTGCFLKMTGWPGLPPCPQNRLTKTCTEKLNEHTHSLFLAFYVDTASMCHHLQSEAFKTETENVVNDLKGSAHWMVDMLKDMESQSQTFLMHFLQESDNIEKKLKEIDMQSELFQEKTENLEGILKSVDGKSKTVLEQSGNLLHMQSKLREQHANMQENLDKGMTSLQREAQESHEQLHGVAEAQKQIAEQQRRLAEAMVAEIDKLQEKASHMTSMVAKSLSGQEQLMSVQEDLLSGQDQALQSLENLHQLQSVAMEETRSSVTGLAEEARKHQREFEVWQLELDHVHRRLSIGSDAMLKAQEAFMGKQSTIFTTLDHLFLLYNTILFESRALKTLFFYGVVIVLVHIVTSAKQTNHARGLLYIGVCISVGMELGLVWLYGRVISSQHWIHLQTYWIRVAYGSITIIIIIYYLITYRDIDVWNNQLLSDLHNMVRKLYSPQLDKYSVSSEDMTSPDLDQIDNMVFHSLEPSGRKKPTKQTVAGKILQKARKIMWRKSLRNKDKVGIIRNAKEDLFSKWMNAHGMDAKILETDSSDDDFTLNDQETKVHGMAFGFPRYQLRSQCKRHTTTIIP